MFIALVACIAFLMGTAVAARIVERRARTLSARRDQDLERVRSLETALASARVGTYTFERDSKRTFCSKTFSELIGFADGRTELSVDDWSHVVHPADRGEMEKTAREAIGECRPHSHDYRACLPNGDIRWLRSYGRPVADASGAVRAVHATVLDITALKKAQLESIQRDERMREISGAAAFSAWELDLETGTYTIERTPTAVPHDFAPDMNPRRVFTQSVDEVVAALHPDDRQALLDLYQRIRSDDVKYELELRWRHDDGTYHRMAAHGRVISHPVTGKRCVRGVTEDMQLHREAEEQLRITDARLL